MNDVLHNEMPKFDQCVIIGNVISALGGTGKKRSP